MLDGSKSGDLPSRSGKNTEGLNEKTEVRTKDKVVHVYKFYIYIKDRIIILKNRG